MSMSQLLSLVEDLRSQIEVPEINDPYLRSVWIMGRNAGSSKVRTAVRHNPNNALPFLKEAPKALRQQMGQKAADVWLNGYNAAVDFVQVKINVMIFNATRGQAIIAR